MKKFYEVLDHPADLRIKVYGQIMEELFINAATAMAQVLKGDTNIKMSTNDTNRIQIKIKSLDSNSLLVDFLNEILSRSQINKAVYLASEVKFQNLKKGALLNSKLISSPVKRFDEDIKAVTYEDLNIKKIGRLYQTNIVFDI